MNRIMHTQNLKIDNPKQWQIYETNGSKNLKGMLQLKSLNEQLSNLKSVIKK